MRDLSLKPRYSSSHALIVGIDEYHDMSHLDHAVHDATALAGVLKNHYSFPDDAITILLNQDAGKARILCEYLSFRTKTDADSRLLVFFAGHGLTMSGSTREAGFLVPQDGTPGELSTLIRWEEFTVNADLIPAKHVLFVMDACYGGLVFNRTAPAGTVRFLKDMMLRPVRQALTAGKQDEPVADGGGPRKGHSIFTGHLLNGLEGEAKAPEGHLTASGLMAYVYKQVSSDIHSRQTPHYGFLSGDGDLVFSASDLDGIPQSSTTESDELITIASLDIPEPEHAGRDPFATAKRHLSDPTQTIALHDLVMHYVRRVAVETSSERLPVENVGYSLEELTKRLQICEEVTQTLRRILACISYWGGTPQRSILGKAMSRVTDHLTTESGLIIWSGLRWYPAILLCYGAGIAALANHMYDNLAAFLAAPVNTARGSGQHATIAEAVAEAIRALEQSDAFKQLPGHDNYYTARSEYLFKFLQPDLDDDLFLGRGYERLFDQFEIILALTNATRRKRNNKSVWGPVGRFGWKFYRGRSEGNPLVDVVEEARALGPDWPPYAAGLFGQDHELFLTVLGEYKQMIGNLGWF